MRCVLVAAALVAGSVAGLCAQTGRPPAPHPGTSLVAPPPVAAHVGSAACASCHAAAALAWQGSQHRRAMQPALRESVLAPFGGERFRAGALEAVFSQRDGRFIVRTQGADGKAADFEVSHVIGIEPLQ